MGSRLWIQEIKVVSKKENKKRFRNTIYFFLRPSDRKTDLLKINLANPKPFKSKLNKEKLVFAR